VEELAQLTKVQVNKADLERHQKQRGTRIKDILVFAGMQENDSRAM